MSNPFANSGTAVATTQAPAQAAPQTQTQTQTAVQAQPQFTQPAPQGDTFGAPASTQAAPVAPAGDAAQDPFAAPSGNSEAKIANYVGELLLIRPKSFDPAFKSSQGVGEMVTIDLAVLSNNTGQFTPGTIENGMYVFQKLLCRDLKASLNNAQRGGQPFLLAKLVKGEASANKSAPYLFQEATEEDKVVARQFLEVFPNF
ncbi:gp41 [Rhodococcus phage ReqiPine5]|uniref:Gp41 n=1 Tax=Rhodococcus phage ReqiPine5 TaxID=691963 RepID=D4P816_9CAUD|nr:gp41 [Rhodococcus phage ReqiPine5]ADD81146.1 gp41 [Rhodococcus phage ReqiPine5]